MTVPEPPWMLTPPTTAAAIAASSKPAPAVTFTVPNWPRNMNPASPASAPHTDERDEQVIGLGQPGLACGIRVGADGVQDPPAAQPREDELQHDGDGERDDEHRAQVEAAPAADRRARQVDDPVGKIVR